MFNLIVNLLLIFFPFIINKLIFGNVTICINFCFISKINEVNSPNLYGLNEYFSETSFKDS